MEITPQDHIKGAGENARVTIVEWSDFQCPACQTYYPVLSQLVEDFPSDVRVIYRHFPLRQIHANANNSALVSEAAALQGKFWEMHNALFDNQEEWSGSRDIAFFDKYASAIGLDIEKYKTDLKSEAAADKVANDLKEALRLNLNSTPTMFVNGKKIANPNSYQEFVDLIAKEITPEVVQ
ncbi:MAG: hypothetical protein A2653_02440 [Candidatus Zambryskibacteria bacterium RIFCSPHIGHO2_01_FULL_43_25]|uniref:Thioredoxin domain-containing protein n=1 Tax=Candidatus Zambryskibacteria bacterium RIFCSPLOWO2_01_FULL_45_21 TaxID=1802761 RepID=A0A1G2U364_9BACT|nr:MAG: hypothetical protein A2653_02440 [Candidatus Zambryskibacteria bacterium RIFCSPHIGHO2_01_FULL_43_25]OHB01078.1 MAG: hypothetical protein A3E94_02620 [Candidatus Zambryskibacteria bacterium RIFCSPHIGHO2_12_FULL_44_12b]OHB03957.1 MAG: hypothetical protein A3B14_01010 [Candidatus Zambryskibacteria bacterium RIFCSPLOWO2_01_FULL_45_21]